MNGWRGMWLMAVLLALLGVRAAAAESGGASLDALLGLEALEQSPGRDADGDADAVVALSDDAGPTDLMRRALSRMGDAAGRLAGDAPLPADVATQRLQREALDSLDALIAQLHRPRPQRGGAGSAGSGEPGQPGQADTGSRLNPSASASASASAATAAAAAAAAAGAADAHGGEASPGSVATAGPAGALEQTDVSGRAWGHLPTQIRGELSQGSSDPFSTVYQPLTEAYYQRLARPLEDDAEGVR